MHPNLIPVHCRTVEDIRALAVEMKVNGRCDPHTEPHASSPTVEAALENAARPALQTDIIESGTLRVVYFPEHKAIVSVVLTYDEFETPPMWNMSISLPNPYGGEPSRVPDNIASMICKGFLGETFQEIPPVGAFKNVRQFVTEATDG